MKKTNMFLLITIPFLMMTIWSFIISDSSGVRGTISPADAVQSVLLISGKDTLRYTPANGQFSIESKPGVYQLIIDAHAGYKDMLLERVVVEEGRMTDIGELVLQKILP